MLPFGQHFQLFFETQNQAEEKEVVPLFKSYMHLEVVDLKSHITTTNTSQAKRWEVAYFVWCCVGPIEQLGPNEVGKNDWS